MSQDLKTELVALLPRLRRFARTMTRSVTEADDLLQEACVRALSRADQRDPTRPLDRWMYRIIRNLWISEMRKRTVRQGQGGVPAEDAVELSTTDTGETQLAARQLGRTISTLPKDLSSILLLVSVEGHSYSEAAEILNIPVGTVMSRMYRARNALADRMAAQGDARP
ncbi:MAG: RNA polymerase sigma factor [Primorskyibacter sp.]